MTARMLESYAMGRWRTAPDEGVTVADAISGEPVARVSSTGLDIAGMLDHARTTGGPALRALTFHQRADILKALAVHLNERREEFYALSRSTGATPADSRVDIDGGIGVLFVYASRGRKELPDGTLYVEGPVEPLGRRGTFAGQHILTPLRGAAVQINAFNFPVWGMLEKLAPAFLAGMPSIVKPAGQTGYMTELVVRAIVASGLLPEGALQLISGSARNLFDHLTGQDMVGFTGSAATAQALRAHPAVTARSVRFNAEADSLNASVLGPDAAPGSPEFDLYIRQLVTEMTVKAGQKCTAIRRALVPRDLLDDVADAASAALAEVRVGDPAHPEVTMGPLASLEQREEVRRAVKTLAQAGNVVFGDPDTVDALGADPIRGAFISPILLRCDDPDRAEPHDVEAFGPVSTLVPYDGTGHAIELLARGEGSLAGSVVSHNPGFVHKIVLGAAAYHGRILVLDRDDAAESTGHGTPLPQLVHGGPGRAGGGEEEGGMRAVLHHMQRTAVQAHPSVLAALTGG